MVVVATDCCDALILFSIDAVFVIVIGQLAQDFMPQRVRALVTEIRKPFSRIYLGGDEIILFRPEFWDPLSIYRDIVTTLRQL